MVIKAVALLKQGWHEVPHLVFGGGLFVFSVITGIFVIRRHSKYDLDRRVWKKRYTVVREEDFDPNVQVYRPNQTFPRL